MSALPPKADIWCDERDVRFGSLAHTHKPMSALCQKQHIAKKDAQKERPPRGRSFRIHTLPSGGSLTLLFVPIFLQTFVSPTSLPLLQ